MYRLRAMDVDDKVCEQVSMTMLSEVYPKDVIERCVHQSEPWSTKARRSKPPVIMPRSSPVTKPCRSLCLTKAAARP